MVRRGQQHRSINKTISMNYPYHEFVSRLCKSGEQITAELTPEQAHLVHMAMGVSGEAGELLDAIKKTAIYGKPLDWDNVIEECGDLLFYIQGVLNHRGVRLDEVVEINRQKLAKRYGDRYSNEAAIERKDKQ